MNALTLTYYDIKRLLRHRPLVLALLALPVAASGARAIFWHSHITLVASWATPFVCAAAAVAVVCWRQSMEATAGLLAGLRSTPLGERGVGTARIMTAALVFAFQIAVFAIILALRF